MKTVVCFGDSNTWGFNPDGTGRYPYEIRWTSVLEEELKSRAPEERYNIIPQGVNGRTTVFEDPVEGDKCGLRHLPVVLQAHKPMDMIIIMLGTNDLKNRFSVNALEIAVGAGRLVDTVRQNSAGLNGRDPEILLVAPPLIKESVPFGFIFQGTVEKSRGFAETYKMIALDRNVHFMNGADYVISSDLDGVHWDPEGHKAFGEAAAEKVLDILQK